MVSLFFFGSAGVGILGLFLLFFPIRMHNKRRFLTILGVVLVFGGFGASLCSCNKMRNDRENDRIQREARAKTVSGEVVNVQQVLVWKKSEFLSCFQITRLAYESFGFKQNCYQPIDRIFMPIPLPKVGDNVTVKFIPPDSDGDEPELLEVKVVETNHSLEDN